MLISVVDIETCGLIEELQYLDYQYLKNRGREKSDEEVERGLSLNPFFAHIISVAVVHVQGDRIEEGVVYYLSGEKEEAYGEQRSVEGEEVEITYHPIPCFSIPRDIADGEQMILTGLWGEIQGSERLVTYNGRHFDVPVLRLRSMLYNLSLPRELELSRYGRGEFHLDLADFLFLKDEAKYTLDFVCRRFGIPLQKGAMDGSKVQEAFLQGRYREIARYNCQDTLMTALLYLRLLPYIAIEETSFPSEKQMEYLVKLVVNREGWERESARRMFAWFQESGVLNRERASRLIDYLKSRST
jgi:DNA polymerase III epsilon subunit-like protein